MWSSQQGKLEEVWSRMSSGAEAFVSSTDTGYRLVVIKNGKTVERKSVRSIEAGKQEADKYFTSINDSVEPVPVSDAETAPCAVCGKRQGHNEADEGLLCDKCYRKIYGKSADSVRPV
jgi:hypothetical protein